MTEEVKDVASIDKQALLAGFFAKYSELVNFIHSLNIHQQFKLNAVTRIDECMFWAREGIVNITAPENQPIAPTPEISEEVA